jgi:hypothetical protein
MYTKTCFMDRRKKRKNRRKEAMIVIEHIVRTMRRKKEGIKRSSRKITDGREATSKIREKNKVILITSRRIIFCHHNDFLDQPEVVASDHVVEQQLRLIRLVAVQLHLEGQVRRDLGKNTHPEKSYEDTCYHVVVVDGVVAAAERDDRNPENTAA